MKDQARISRERPAQIFSAHVAQASDSVKADLGKKETVKRIIRNVQRGGLPKDSATLQELTIDGEWSQTSREEPFLIHDSGPDSHNRVIVFASKIGLWHLATKDTWYMDGTFKVAPKLFEQVYIIRAKLGESAVTCAYSLMTGKSQDLYQEMLQAIVTKCEELGFSPDPVDV